MLNGRYIYLNRDNNIIISVRLSDPARKKDVDPEWFFTRQQGNRTRDNKVIEEESMKLNSSKTEDRKI